MSGLFMQMAAMALAFNHVTMRPRVASVDGPADHRMGRKGKAKRRARKKQAAASRRINRRK
jgi:hypothetical protein